MKGNIVSKPEQTYEAIQPTEYVNLLIHNAPMLKLQPKSPKTPCYGPKTPWTQQVIYNLDDDQSYGTKPNVRHGSSQKTRIY